MPSAWVYRSIPGHYTVTCKRKHQLGGRLAEISGQDALQQEARSVDEVERGRARRSWTTIAGAALICFATTSLAPTAAVAVQDRRALPCSPPRPLNEPLRRPHIHTLCMKFEFGTGSNLRVDGLLHLHSSLRNALLLQSSSPKIQLSTTILSSSQELIPVENLKFYLKKLRSIGIQWPIREAYGLCSFWPCARVRACACCVTVFITFFVRRPMPSDTIRPAGRHDLPASVC